VCCGRKFSRVLIFFLFFRKSGKNETEKIQNINPLLLRESRNTITKGKEEKKEKD